MAENFSDRVERDAVVVLDWRALLDVAGFVGIDAGGFEDVIESGDEIAFEDLHLIDFVAECMKRRHGYAPLLGPKLYRSSIQNTR